MITVNQLIVMLGTIKAQIGGQAVICVADPEGNAFIVPADVPSIMSQAHIEHMRQHYPKTYAQFERHRMLFIGAEDE